MRAEAPIPGRITDAKVHTFMKDRGGSRFTHLSYGEKGDRDIVLVEDASPPFILKKKLRVIDKERIDMSHFYIEDYETSILGMLLPHIDHAPVAVPTVFDEDRASGLFIAEYMPGTTLSDTDVTAMKPSEKKALGIKLSQYVHWFAQAIPLDNVEFRDLHGSSLKPYNKAAALLDINEFTITSDDLENAGQYALADVREEQVREYNRLRRDGNTTERTIVGHNDLKPSNFVFNTDDTGDLVLSSIIDYELAQPSTPEMELRRTPQMGDEVMYAAIKEYHRLTGTHLDESLIKFWERVQFVQWAMGATVKDASIETRQFLAGELQRIYPTYDWREVSGEITYPNND